MQLHKAIVLVSLAAVVVWGTAAQDEPLKIGIVDVDEALTSTAEGKAARDELSRKQREAQAKIQPLLERLEIMEDDFKAKRFLISDEARFQKQLDLAELQNEIESKAKELKGQLQVDQERLRGPLLAKLNDIIQDVGKSEGYTVILHRAAPGLLYAREALDVTDRVIEKYNQKS